MSQNGLKLCLGVDYDPLNGEVGRVKFSKIPLLGQESDLSYGDF